MEVQSMSSVQNVTDTTFDQEVTKSDRPVLVDFWAPWCGPCKAVAPVVDDLAKEYDGRLKVVKLNTDENPKTAQAYSIRGIPSLYLFKNGQVVEQVVGAVPKSTLVAAINKHV
jgi:thioredoxin 1